MPSTAPVTPHRANRTSSYWSAFSRYVDGFILCMLAAVGLALLYPRLGTSNGPLSLGMVTTYGVAVVFFLHGAALSPSRLAAGVTNWRLHLFVQASTFVLFPLIGIAMLFGLAPVMPQELLIGLFYLCALPSTVSSSVALVAVARGNVPGAVFNATLSGMLGILITPLLMHAIAGASGSGPSLRDAFTNVALQLLLPFILGQALGPLVRGWLQRHRGIVSKVDRAIILLIVYESFCDATASGVWTQYGLRPVVIALVLAVVLLALVLTLTTWAARRLGFSKEDEIAAVFCGSKKSLAYGVPMARILLAGHPALGLIVLPLMVYHQVQLVACSVIAGRYARRETASIASADSIGSQSPVAIKQPDAALRDRLPA